MMATWGAFEYTPVTSVAQAVEAMTAIGTRLPPTDGISAFNRMYAQVTQRVAVAIRDGTFTNSAFLDRLDVVFANHYLSAVAYAEAGADIPRCWEVLWQHRDASDRSPIQFAVAGMNAHINHDLVLALVATFTELGLSPRDPVVRSDFKRVNALLVSLDREIRRGYEQGLMLEIDRHLGRIEDCVDNWSIARARAAAWHDAQILWQVRNHLALRRHYERMLDDATAAAGRSLLLPHAVHSSHRHTPCVPQAPTLPDGPGHLPGP
jgi:hypothetical protein